jgi:hypothetical protein
MDPVVALLLKNGVFGILAGIGFYLYFKERKINQEYAKSYLDHQVADTAAKTKLTVALEDLATTLEAVETHAKTDLSACRKHSAEVLRYFQQYVEENRLEKAREEGRREVTGRFKLPTGDDDESR